MKLATWLKRNGVSRVDFARRIGVSPGAITQLCREEGAWLSRETALLIARETGGEVTPNDFLTPPQGPEETHMPQSVQAAIDAFAQGEMVVVSDDDDREGEGDLFVAASLCTPEKMAFIVRHTSGIVCAPMPAEAARRLRLEPMVSVNDAPLGTAFTVTVDARHGLTTGISATERTNTVRALADPAVAIDDFVRPGHVFPLVARDGGVLVRSGHTEACVDLCRAAGLPPVGVLAELVNDDGTVMRGGEVARFAEQHGLQRITIDELIAHRQTHEKLIERVATFPVATAIGELTGYAYVTKFDTVQHLAFVHGRIGDGIGVPARLHRADVVDDVMGGGTTIARTLASFEQEGRGVLVYLRDANAWLPVHEADAAAASSDDARGRSWRESGLGAQILRDLGVSSIKLLSSAPGTAAALERQGIAIEATAAVSAEAAASVG